MAYSTLSQQIEEGKEFVRKSKGDKENGIVIITQKEYKKLLDDSRQLRWLEQNGVDNWEGYTRYPSDE